MCGMDGTLSASWRKNGLSVCRSIAHFFPCRKCTPLPTMVDVMRLSENDLSKSPPGFTPSSTFFTISGSRTTRRVSDPHQYRNRLPAHCQFHQSPPNVAPTYTTGVILHTRTVFWEVQGVLRRHGGRVVAEVVVVEG
jgi:hypothetical protein